MFAVVFIESNIEQDQIQNINPLKNIILTNFSFPRRILQPWVETLLGMTVVYEYKTSFVFIQSHCIWLLPKKREFVILRSVPTLVGNRDEGKKESPSVETERPLTIACHMKNRLGITSAGKLAISISNSPAIP